MFRFLWHAIGTKKISVSINYILYFHVDWCCLPQTNFDSWACSKTAETYSGKGRRLLRLQ